MPDEKNYDTLLNFIYYNIWDSYLHVEVFKAACYNLMQNISGVSYSSYKDTSRFVTGTIASSSIKLKLSEMGKLWVPIFDKDLEFESFPGAYVHQLKGVHK